MILFYLLLSIANAQCIDQLKEHRFLVLRRIDFEHVAIRTTNAETSALDSYIGAAAVIVATGSVVPVLDFVFKDTPPPRAEFTRDAVLKTDDTRSFRMPKRIRRIGHSLLNNKEVDLWEVCQ